MLGKSQKEHLVFEAYPHRIPPYEVRDPKIEILDEMSARFTAKFCGPPGSTVIGRAWISDMDGTLVDGETGEIPANTTQEMVLTFSEPKRQNGNLIGCMRVEWPLNQTKHVIQCTLVQGDMVHSPRGKQC